MTNLTELFKEILLTNDSITIPGFGTLETQYQPAQLDEKTGTIYPPAKIVKLDTGKTTDKENALETYIMQTQPVNQTTARLQIEQLVKDIKEKLDKNETITLDEVGIIAKDESGATIIKAVPNNLMIDNYGMDPVEVEAAKAAARTSKGKTVKTTTTTTTKATTVKTSSLSSSVRDTKPAESEEKETKKKSGVLKWLLILLPIVALITLYILYMEPVNNWVAGLFASKPKTDTTQTVAPAPQDTAKPKNTVPDLGETEVVDDPETKMLLDAGFSTTPLNIGSNFKKYYLIAGSFTTIKNAQKRQRELPGSKILTVGDQHRVYVGSSDKADDILKQYNDLKKKQPGLEVWLLKNAK